MSRQESLRSSLHGWSRLAVIYAICLAAIVAAIFTFVSVTWIELLIVPVAILFSNLMEYVIHRWPMHGVIFAIKGLYKAHSGGHHRYFTDDNMVMRDAKDINAIITKNRTILFLTLAIILPGSLFLAAFSWDIGVLFWMTTFGYYLFYEFTHLMTHLPSDHWIMKIPYFRSARHRHMLHHNTRLMHWFNFNISFPLFDWFFGTLYSKEKKHR